MTLSLVIITFCFLSNYILVTIAQFVSDEVEIVHEPRIDFNTLIANIYQRAIQSVTINKDIIAVYENVFGTTNVMNGVSISQLIVYFNSASSIIGIYKHLDGMRYYDVTIDCKTQNADTITMKPVPNGINGHQLLFFTERLLTRLHVRYAWFTSNIKVEYIGCYGEIKNILNVDLDAINGPIDKWYDRYGADESIEQEIRAKMQSIQNRILSGKYTFDGYTWHLDKDYKLGILMPAYWESNKCAFSIIYGALNGRHFFDSIHDPNIRYKDAISQHNMDRPYLNIFHAPQGRRQ